MYRRKITPYILVSYRHSIYSPLCPRAGGATIGHSRPYGTRQTSFTREECVLPMDNCVAVLTMRMPVVRVRDGGGATSLRTKGANIWREPKGIIWHNNIV